MIKNIDNHPWKKKVNIKEKKNDLTYKQREQKRGKILEFVDFLSQKIQGTKAQKSQISFEDIKVHLQRKGYVESKFGRLEIILHNLETDNVRLTQGFTVFRFRLILEMMTSWFISNLELITFGIIMVL